MFLLCFAMCLLCFAMFLLCFAMFCYVFDMFCYDLLCFAMFLLCIDPEISAPGCPECLVLTSKSDSMRKLSHRVEFPDLESSIQIRIGGNVLCTMFWSGRYWRATSREHFSVSYNNFGFGNSRLTHESRTLDEISPNSTS